MAADGLKQRLVGGATLLVVAVFAWFWLLSADSPVDPVARESQIPAAPDIQPFAVQEPVAPKDIAPIGSARDSQPALQSDVVPQANLSTQSNSGAQANVTSTSAAQPSAVPKAVEAKPTNASATNKSAIAKSNDLKSSVQNNTAPKAQTLKSSTLATTKNEPAATIKSEPKVAAKPTKDSKLVPETFQLDQHGLPIAWVVQVGLFSSQASADKIKATLQEKGFKAYTEVFKSDKASGIKVFVGPKLSRERADAQKKAIDQLLKTNSMVVRFAAN